MSKRKATHNLSSLNEDGDFVPSNSAAKVAFTPNNILSNIENTAGARQTTDDDFLAPTAFSEKRKKKSMTTFNASQIVDFGHPSQTQERINDENATQVTVKVNRFIVSPIVNINMKLIYRILNI
jgi:hypothetical protein